MCRARKKYSSLGNSVAEYRLTRMESVMMAQYINVLCHCVQTNAGLFIEASVRTILPERYAALATSACQPHITSQPIREVSVRYLPLAYNLRGNAYP